MNRNLVFALGTILVLSALLASCGGGGTSTKPGIVVQVSAAANAVDAGGQTTITASVSNDSSNQGVRWSISPATGAGYLINVTPGSVTYKAPATLAANGSVTITGTAIADNTTSGAVSIQLNAITVSVTTSAPSVGAGGAAVINAQVSNDVSNQGVMWSISPPSGAGSLSNTTSTSATYNAPPAPPASDVQITITATAIADNSKSGAVTITFATVQVSVGANPGSVQASGTASVTATVSNDPSNQGVTWSMSPSSGAGSLSNPTSTSVTYNAPATPPASDLGVTITATSVADNKVAGSTTVTVLAITVGVAPSSALIPVAAAQQYTATVNNDPVNKGTTWTLTQNGSACSPSCGTVSPTVTLSGISTTYTAPAAVPANPAATLTATSVEDNTKSATTAITVSVGTVELVPALLDFGSVKTGGGSRILTVTLTNTGAATLTISSGGVTITGSSEFTETSNCVPSVAAGASCVINVTFRPTVTQLETAVLSISDSSAGSPQQVPLSGSGFRRRLATVAVQSALARRGSVAAPVPTVTAKVGTRVLELVDTDRDDPYLANGSKRDLLVRFWYPAALDEGCQAAAYTPAQVWSYFSQLKKITLPRVSTNSCWNAPLSSGPHPVVVFTHGYTGTFTDYTFLSEELASRGYVVASVDHTYEATAVEFPDGRLVKSLVGSYLAGNARMDEKTIKFAVGVRLGDLKFVLNELDRLNAASDGPFAGQLDMSRVALAGHSVGGLTTLLGVEEEPRFRAGVILDGILPDNVRPSTQTPMLVITTGNDTWGADDCRLWKGLRGARVAVNLKGAEHMTPSDAVWIAKYAIKTGSMGPDRTIAAVRDYVAAFLDAYLMGKPASRLLRGASTKYADATVATNQQSVCEEP